jgi:hypothetical protein
MGIKVQPLLGDEEIKQKAQNRKDESDQILELVYEKLKKGAKKHALNN